MEFKKRRECMRYRGGKRKRKETRYEKRSRVLQQEKNEINYCGYDRKRE